MDALSRVVLSITDYVVRRMVPGAPNDPGAVKVHEHPATTPTSEHPEVGESR
jgi:hypothetical protein